MDYYTRYGLEFNPFLKNSLKEVFIETAECKEAMIRLDYLSKTKGFGVLTGAPGRGKTTVVRNWTQKLNPSLYKVIYTSLSTLTANDFYRNFVHELGSEAAYRKPENFRIIQNEITRLSVEKRKTPIIVIDEANYINTAILNDLKILFNFEMDSRDRAVILLTGLPQLNLTLNLRMHEPLKQRIVMNYNMDGLSKEEGRIYIKEKLKSAGCMQEIFEDAAIEAILNAADGTPRMINKYCNSAMIIGDSEKSDIINADIVMKSVNDCELE